jgi:hypothetical protein
MRHRVLLAALPAAVSTASMASAGGVSRARQAEGRLTAAS